MNFPVNNIKNYKDNMEDLTELYNKCLNLRYKTSLLYDNQSYIDKQLKAYKEEHWSFYNNKITENDNNINKPFSLAYAYEEVNKGCNKNNKNDIASVEGFIRKVGSLSFITENTLLTRVNDNIDKSINIAANNTFNNNNSYFDNLICYNPRPRIKTNKNTSKKSINAIKEKPADPIKIRKAPPTYAITNNIKINIENDDKKMPSMASENKHHKKKECSNLLDKNIQNYDNNAEKNIDVNNKDNVNEKNIKILNKKKSAVEDNNKNIIFMKSTSPTSPNNSAFNNNLGFFKKNSVGFDSNIKFPSPAVVGNADTSNNNSFKAFPSQDKNNKEDENYGNNSKYNESEGENSKNNKPLLKAFGTNSLDFSKNTDGFGNFGIPNKKNTIGINNNSIILPTDNPFKSSSNKASFDNNKNEEKNNLKEESMEKDEKNKNKLKENNANDNTNIEKPVAKVIDTTSFNPFDNKENTDGFGNFGFANKKNTIGINNNSINLPTDNPFKSSSNKASFDNNKNEEKNDAKEEFKENEEKDIFFENRDKDTSADNKASDKDNSLCGTKGSFADLVPTSLPYQVIKDIDNKNILNGQKGFTSKLPNKDIPLLFNNDNRNSLEGKEEKNEGYEKKEDEENNKKERNKTFENQKNEQYRIRADSELPFPRIETNNNKIDTDNNANAEEIEKDKDDKENNIKEINSITSTVISQLNTLSGNSTSSDKYVVDSNNATVTAISTQEKYSFSNSTGVNNNDNYNNFNNNTFSQQFPLKQQFPIQKNDFNNNNMNTSAISENQNNFNNNVFNNNNGSNVFNNMNINAFNKNNDMNKPATSAFANINNFNNNINFNQAFNDKNNNNSNNATLTSGFADNPIWGMSKVSKTMNGNCNSNSIIRNETNFMNNNNNYDNAFGNTDINNNFNMLGNTNNTFLNNNKMNNNNNEGGSNVNNSVFNKIPQNLFGSFKKDDNISKFGMISASAFGAIGSHNSASSSFNGGGAAAFTKANNVMVTNFFPSAFKKH